jgi:UDPglucose 6-dehydrogenase
MKVCVIGTGYAGLTTGTVLADLGHNVTCVDRDSAKINLLNNGKIPIFEPSLDEMVKKNTANKNLSFSTNIQENIKHNSIIIIAVGTPSLEDGTTNLSFIEKVTDDLTASITTFKTIITKSTVPLGVNEWIKQTLIAKGVDPQLFEMVSNPEFLREGSAVHDMLHPDKIVVGCTNSNSLQTIKTLYQGIIDTTYIVTSLNGAELIKYASNAFLATKISFINEMAQICDAYGVDVKIVSSALGTDPRIGPLFLNAGLGYGGSCLPKDLNALSNSAITKNIQPALLQAVQKVNQSQIAFYIHKLEAALNALKGKKLTIWGLAFKPDTDDVRESPAIRFIQQLLEKGCEIHAYDPAVQLQHNTVQLHKDMYKAVKNSDALILATEWKQFITADWHKVKSTMKGNVLLDGRNSLNPQSMRSLGFNYIGVGRS